LNLSPRLSEALKALSQREGVTLFMTLLTAFQMLLSRYSGQEDIVVGTPVANRTHVELEGMVGCFINLLALRTDLTGNPGFRELLRRVREMTLAAYAHQNIPFEQVVEAMQLRHDLSHTPLFQVLFVLQNMPHPTLELTGVSLRTLGIENNSTQFDVILSLEEVEEGLYGYFQYNTDLFEAATIARIATHWCNLLEGIVADPGRRLWEYPLLSDLERQQLLVEWNATQATYPRESVIHELFEAQVERNPDATAVVFANQQLTYRDLNTRANQLACYLRGK
jgi:non-ribosomal peptide synthetase component F